MKLILAECVSRWQPRDAALQWKATISGASGGVAKLFGGTTEDSEARWSVSGFRGTELKAVKPSRSPDPASSTGGFFGFFASAGPQARAPPSGADPSTVVCLR